MQGVVPHLTRFLLKNLTSVFTEDLGAIPLTGLFSLILTKVAILKMVYTITMQIRTVCSLKPLSYPW